MADDGRVEVVLKSHVQDPATFKTFLVGEHEMDVDQAHRLLSVHPDLVEIKDSEVPQEVPQEVQQEQEVSEGVPEDEALSPDQVDPSEVFGREE